MFRFRCWYFESSWRPLGRCSASSGGGLREQYRLQGARLADVVTRKQVSLSDFEPHFVARPVRGSFRAVLTFEPRPPPLEASSAVAEHQDRDLQTCALLAQAWGGSLRAAKLGDIPVVSHGIREVVPQALRHHLQEMESRGSPHRAFPRLEKSRTVFVLDIPLPLQLNLTSWRCRTCEDAGEPAQYSATFQDLLLTVPGTLRHCTRRLGTHYMSKRFLLYFVQGFFEKLCVSACRRSVVDLYNANALAFGGGARALQYFAAVLDSRAFGAILLQGLENFLGAKVKQMTQLVNVYSGSVVRGDGHWRLAQRIADRIAEQRWPVRKWNCLLCWSGVDGAILQPPTPSTSEAIEDILIDLHPLVDNLKADRLAHGLSMDEAAPIAHSTDSYGKHLRRYDDFYIAKFAEADVVVQAATPKSDAAGAVAAQRSSARTRICGDPAHSWFEFRRCLSIGACDRQDIDADYSFSIAELREKPLSPDLLGDPVPSEPSELPESAHGLLQAAVQQTASDFQTRFAAAPAEATFLKEFLKQARVDEAATWEKLFNAMPPRGTLARLARRSHVVLHKTCAFQGYTKVAQFKQQLRRIRGWYKPGRKVSRRKIGIKRRRHEPGQVRGRKTAITPSVKRHFRRLRKPLKMEALWNWHAVAMEILQAGIPLQTGTLPCERFWNSLTQMLPSGARNIRLRWFKLLCQIAFLQHNYRHYNASFLPAWCRGDALLSQRIDNLAGLIRALEGDETVAHLIFDRFDQE